MCRRFKTSVFRLGRMLFVVFFALHFSGCNMSISPPTDSKETEPTTFMTTTETTETQATMTNGTTAYEHFLPEEVPTVDLDSLSANEKIIFDYYAAIGNNWDRLLELTDPSVERASMKAWLENEESQEKHLGILNIKSARVVDIVRLYPEDPEDRMFLADYNNYCAAGLQVEPYLVGFYAQTYKNTNFFYTGVNYALVYLKQWEGAWYYMNGEGPDGNLVQRKGDPLFTRDFFYELQRRGGAALYDMDELIDGKPA